jgi:hypothetical protein
MGKKNYFLRSTASPEVPIERAPITEDMLPASWRGRTEQPLVKPQGATGQQWAAEFADELKARGLTPREAIDAVSANPSLPPMVRLQIVEALKRAR